MIALFVACLLPATLFLAALPILLLGSRPKGVRVAPRARCDV
jgi:hypothetical protein